MAKILRKPKENHKVQFPKLSLFIGQKFIIHHYCIKNVVGGIQIQVYKINKESATNFCQFISVEV